MSSTPTRMQHNPYAYNVVAAVSLSVDSDLTNELHNGSIEGAMAASGGTPVPLHYHRNNGFAQQMAYHQHAAIRSACRELRSPSTGFDSPVPVGTTARAGFASLQHGGTVVPPAVVAPREVAGAATSFELANTDFDAATPTDSEQFRSKTADETPHTARVVDPLVELHFDNVPVPPDRIVADANRVHRRDVQIAKGKATEGYKAYTAAVRRTERQMNNPAHPITPRTNVNVSKRHFDALTGAWRRALHQWDVEMPDAGRLDGLRTVGELQLITSDEPRPIITSMPASCGGGAVTAATPERDVADVARNDSVATPPGSIVRNRGGDSATPKDARPHKVRHTPTTRPTVAATAAAQGQQPLPPPPPPAFGALPPMGALPHRFMPVVSVRIGGPPLVPLQQPATVGAAAAPPTPVRATLSPLGDVSRSLGAEMDRASPTVVTTGTPPPVQVIKVRREKPPAAAPAAPQQHWGSISAV